MKFLQKSSWAPEEQREGEYEQNQKDFQESGSHDFHFSQ